VYERAIDFIILHERRGMLAWEVKGGKIRIGEDRNFEQYQGAKGWRPIDPFKEVKLATMELIDDCRDDGVNYWIPVDRCVIFPNTPRRDITDLPQYLPSGVL
jgi:Nuclease-related domain